MSDREELIEVWRDFYGRMDALERSSEPYPPDWEPVVQSAIYAKRQGHYAGSARIYTSLMVDNGIMYTGALSGLYKTLAAGDLALQALMVATLANSIYEKNPNPVAQAAGIPSTFADHIERLKDAMTSEGALTSYLREISGNPGYRLARDYSTIAAEWKSATDAIVKGFGPQKKSGCYIATAVYGSYDAPEVVVLREFRDRRLATSLAGRAFIRIYYTVSPSLAKHFSGSSFLTRLARIALDAVINRLR